MKNTIFILNAPQDAASALTSRPFANDALAVIAIDEAALARIGNGIRSYEGFLNRAAIADIAKTVEPSERADVVARFVDNMGGLFYESELDLPAFGGKVEAMTREHNAEHFSAEQIERLRNCLQLLAIDANGLHRQKKAEALLTRTGNALQDVAITCDLRPVMDDKREHVCGVIPLTTMTLEIESEDGLPKAYDIRLSAAQLRDLHEEVTVALRKLESFDGFCREKNIQLAKV